ncbi:CDP-glycerol glycerophosphotransferase family protein [Terrisporobacter sp.]
MTKKILDSIPEEYKEKVIVLPHPLIAESMSKVNGEISKYMDFKSKYNDLLKDAKVLITDYSSISYDAFYRGSNVIFYWEEKDYCMECYGDDTKLMLNEDNIFGDICYDMQDLKSIFEKNYTQNQDEKYLYNYRQIVEFNDNKNTERLIKLLKKDNLI